MAQSPLDNDKMPTLPSAALTAKVIPLEGEAGIAEEKAANAKGTERSDCAGVSENAAGEEEATNHKGEASEEKAVAMETPTQEPEAEEFQRLAFYCLSVSNPLRAICIRAYKNPNFDRFFMTIIFANCITLALFNPLDPECLTDKCKALYVFDTSFWVLFAIEMIAKMIALGVFGPGAFVDSKWNRFDAFIVFSGVIDFLPGVEGGPLTSLRTFRVLRPLRAINKFPRMRVLVKLLLDTIPMLASVGMLCFLIFFIFGILAVQFWSGLFHQRCFDPSIPRSFANYTYYNKDSDGEEPYICAYGSGSENTGIASCSASGADPRFMQPDACRRDGPAPFYGAIHYDNILSAWIVLFQIITLEGWVDQMYLVQGAYNFHTGWIYFCTLVVIGSFFAINLALVVISSQFGNTKGSEMAAVDALEKAEKARRRREEAEAKANGYVPTFWEKLKKGDCASETEEQVRTRLETRLAHLQTLAKATDDGDARSVIETDIANLTAELARDGNNVEDEEQPKVLRVTRAEAKAQGGIQVLRWSVREFTTIKEDFGNFIMAAIALNVTLMAVEHHGQPDGLTLFLDIANIIFCSIFGIEMVLKQFALGFGEYFADNFNCFDCLIVIISFVELGLGGGGLSALRMLRLVRIFKLVKFLPELQRQFVIMGETLGSVLSFLLLLGLFIFIFAVLGMFIFGNNLTFTEEDDYGTYTTTSRKNFDTLLWALVTIFQTLTLEDWNVGMYNGVRGMKSQWAALYFILLIMLGNYIMFNLFVAILIDGFGAEEDEELEEDSTSAENEVTQVESLVTEKSRRVSKSEAADMLASVAHLHSSDAKEGSGVGAASGALARYRRRIRKARLSQTPPPSSKVAPMSAKVAPMSESGFGTGSGVGSEAAEIPLDSVTENPLDATPPPLASPPPLVARTETEATSKSDASAKYEVGPEGEGTQEPEVKEEVKEAEEKDKNGCFGLEHRDHALFVFGPNNPIRRGCDTLRLYPWFDQVVMASILANSITMAMERPSIQDDSTERHVLDAFGHAFNLIFTIEFFVKVIALGLFIGPDVYWKSGWNKLDGCIVWISWIDLALTIAGVSGGMLSILKICRMFRALRPLRAVSRLPGLKRVVNVLILSLAPIGTTLIIVGVFFFLFGVLGGQIFAGKFFYCDSEDRMIMDKVVTKADCLKYAGPNSWINQPYNFDHLGNSLMTLFVLSSIDGWVDIMYAGVDIVGVDMQPQENHSEGLVLFFILFLLIGGFFIINMFVGVIVENFQKHGAPPPVGEPEEGETLEPDPEPDNFEDRENYSTLRRSILTHATSTAFESFIAAIIVINVIVMGSEHYNPDVATPENNYDGMSDAFQMYLRISNYLFTAIFIYELAVKYIAFGFTRFHKGSFPRSLAAWNNFDWFIVAVSILGILIDDVIGADNVPIDPGILKILRILRVARILKLLKSAKELVILLNTVARSLAQVGNLGLLLFLLFFIYAALGIELFGRLACTSNFGCDGISEYANFKNFGMAMLVLFRLSTGDNWNGMMKDGLRGEPPLSLVVNNTAKYGNKYGCSFAVDCDSSTDECCGGCNPDESCKINCCASAAITPIYYISFCVLSTFVMLNLVVATLMGELERAGVESDGAEEAEHAEEEAKKKPSVDTSKAADKAGDTAVTDFVAEKEEEEEEESPVLTPSPVSGGSSLGLGDDGPSVKLDSRVKLEPLEKIPVPARPLSPAAPSVFEPFAPETIAHDDPEEVVHDDAAANSEASP